MGPVVAWPTTGEPVVPAAFCAAVPPAGAAALAALAGLAVAGEEMLLVAIVDQGVQPLDRLGPDIAAPAPVPAIGAAVFDELLAPERHAAGPAAT